MMIRSRLGGTTLFTRFLIERRRVDDPRGSAEIFQLCVRGEARRKELFELFRITLQIWPGLAKDFQPLTFTPRGATVDLQMHEWRPAP